MLIRLQCVNVLRKKNGLVRNELIVIHANTFFTILLFSYTHCLNIFIYIASIGIMLYYIIETNSNLQNYNNKSLIGFRHNVRWINACNLMHFKWTRSSRRN